MVERVLPQATMSAPIAVAHQPGSDRLVYVIDREPPYTLHRDSATVIIEWDSNGHNGGDIAFGPGALYDKAVAAGVDEKDRWAWVGRQTASLDPDAKKYIERRSSLLSKSLHPTSRLANPFDAAHPLEARCGCPSWRRASSMKRLSR